MVGRDEPTTTGGAECGVNESRRVAYLNPSGRFGGAERSLIELMTGLRMSRPTWHLSLVVVSDGPLADRARALGVAVNVLPFPLALARFGEISAIRQARGLGRLAVARDLTQAAIGAVSYIHELRRLLGELRPDIVHSNGLKMHLLSAWARPASSVLVWHLHDYIAPRPLSRRLLRYHQRACDLVVSASRSVHVDATRAGIAARRVEVVYNAVDTDAFTPVGAVADIDRLAGLPPAASNTVRVGLVGALARWKGHDVFLRALASLDPSLPVRGYVVGDAVYDTDGSQYTLSELAERAAAEGLAGTIGFTGFVDDLPEVIRALDVVVHASVQREPFGLAVAEAMACGKAVVVSNTGGVSEIIDPGVTAIGVPPGDAGAMAHAISLLVSDVEQRKRLGAAARPAVQRFSRDALVQRVLPLYDDAIALRDQDTARVPVNVS